MQCGCCPYYFFVCSFRLVGRRRPSLLKTTWHFASHGLGTVFASHGLVELGQAVGSTRPWGRPWATTGAETKQGATCGCHRSCTATCLRAPPHSAYHGVATPYQPKPAQWALPPVWLLALVAATGAADFAAVAAPGAGPSSRSSWLWPLSNVRSSDRFILWVCTNPPSKRNTELFLSSLDELSPKATNSHLLRSRPGTPLNMWRHKQELRPSTNSFDARTVLQALWLSRIHV